MGVFFVGGGGGDNVDLERNKLGQKRYTHKPCANGIIGTLLWCWNIWYLST